MLDFPTELEAQGNIQAPRQAVKAHSLIPFPLSATITHCRSFAGHSRLVSLYFAILPPSPLSFLASASCLSLHGTISLLLSSPTSAVLIHPLFFSFTFVRSPGPNSFISFPHQSYPDLPSFDFPFDNIL